MKIDARRVGAFLQDPGACRVVLLYGEDEGLIRERAAALIRTVIGGADDPFRFTDLDRDGIPNLPGEAAALSLTGGRRVIRVRDAGDTATGAVKAVLDGRGEALVVIEAPGLASRSRLRATVEAAPLGAAIGCYAEEGRALEATVRDGLKSLGVSIDPDAVDWLAGQLGADRASTRQEIEKLALFAGNGGHVDIETARLCVGDLAGLSLDDALFAATEGDVATADRALELAIAEGATPVGILRAGLMHLQRLHRVRSSMPPGTSAADAAKGARPPVFFRRLPAFTRALGRWSQDGLAAAMSGVSDAERACKRTGAPAEIIARNAVLTLARRAAALGRASRA
jgi:DNA polymerase-3 subunit delta